MSGLLIGYARVSTASQDLAAQRAGLAALGVPEERTYVDHGLTGTNRDRPGLREALAGCREGDTPGGHQLDRLARSVPDARDIVDELTRRGVRLSIGGSVHDPQGPIGGLLCTDRGVRSRPGPGSHSRGPGGREGQGHGCAASSPSSARTRKRT